VNQRTVVEHRQVETGAVPADQLGDVAIDEAKEIRDQLALVVLLRTETAHAQALRVAETAADRDDAMQVQRQKVRAGLLAALGKRALGDLGIGQRLPLGP